MDWNLISIIVFYTVIIAFFIKNRNKIERQGIFLLYKTKKGLNLIAKIAKKWKRFWKGFGNLAIYVGFAGIFAVLFLLAYKALEIFMNPSPTAGVALAIPGIRIPGSPIFIPFWYGIIALIVVLLVHEGSHGLVAKAHGLKLKSAGVGLLAFLPLAFVEPDEDQLKKAPLKTKLSVFGAGPLANLATALIIILLSAVLAPISTMAFQPNGLTMVGVVNGFPAQEAGITAGDEILGVNGIQTLSIKDFSNVMDEIKPGEEVQLMTSQGNILTKTTEDPKNKSRAYLGISFTQDYKIKDNVYKKFGKTPWLLIYLLKLFNWIFVLNLGIGIINLLPLGPIDGGRMVDEVLKEKMKNKKRAKKIFKTISYISLFLLLINLLGPYLMKI